MRIRRYLIRIASIELTQLHIHLLLKFVGTDVPRIDLWFADVLSMQPLHLAAHILIDFRLNICATIHRRPFLRLRTAHEIYFL